MSSTQQSKSPPANRDTCAWKCCSYPNGLLLIAIAQVALFLACVLSSGAVVDCSFVKANLNTTELFTTDHKDINPNPDVQRSLGFFFFEAEDGDCHWDYKSEDDFENYIDLTSSWHPARRSIVTAVAFGWILFVWSLFFSCVAHPRLVRFIFGGLLVIVAALQAGSFAVLDSSFCDDFDCKYSRSGGGQSVSAILFFATSGVLFFFTKNYSPEEAIAPAFVRREDPVDVENPDGTEGTFVQQEAPARIVSPPPNDGIADAQEVKVPDEATLPTVNSKMATLY